MKQETTLTVKLSDISNATKTIKVPLDPEPITIEFRLGWFTPATGSRIVESGNPIGTIAEILAAGIVSWDLADDKEKPLPISPASFDLMPNGLIELIYDTMRRESLPNSMKASS
jgi:hypothetical protein